MSENRKIKNNAESKREKDGAVYYIRGIIEADGKKFQRYAVATMLNDGEIYNRIVDKTGASTATISRVNRALNYGSDGYVLTINRVRKEEENN